MNNRTESIILSDLISNKETIQKSNILFTLSTLKSSESFHKALQSLRFKKKEEVRDGLVSYQLPSKNKEIIKIGFDEELNIGIFITKLRKSDQIPNKLEEPLRFQKDIAQLWIKPLILSDMLNTLKEKHRRLKLTWFSGINEPKHSEGFRRPEVKRALQYSGEDGLEALDEMKIEYGIMPKILEFSIPQIGGYRIDNRGIISIRKGSLEPIYDSILGAIEEMKPWLSSFNKSRISYFESDLFDHSLKIRKVVPWKVRLGKPLFANDLKSFEYRISDEEELFSTMNRYVKKDEDDSISTYYSLYTDEKNYSSFGVEFLGSDNTFSIYPHKDKSLSSMFNFINALHDNLEPNIECA